MKYYLCLLALFIGIATSTSFLHVQVSAISNIKNKFKVMNQVKDFAGCDATRETLIHPQCVIEGVTEEKDRQKLCDDYTKDLEKLDCKKDKCEDFYKKYNQANIKYASSQAKYFKGKKDKEREERSKQQAEDLKKNEKDYVKNSCMVDEAGKAMEIKEEDKKEKK